jgi:hypothetical protein
MTTKKKTKTPKKKPNRTTATATTRIGSRTRTSAPGSHDTRVLAPGLYGTIKKMTP